MNGVHDMGGLDCFGSVAGTESEPHFHEEWESRVLALCLAMGATGSWNLDQSRFARESLPAADYLSIGYYRIWLAALEQLLVEKKLVSKVELNSGQSENTPKTLKSVLTVDRVDAVLDAGGPVSRPSNSSAAFDVGDKVCVRNRHVQTHTRMPGYIRGKAGIIERVHGCHVYPDSNAQGLGENPQWLYCIRFEGRELWGTDDDSLMVMVDCWEPYLMEAQG